MGCYGTKALHRLVQGLDSKLEYDVYRHIIEDMHFIHCD